MDSELSNTFRLLLEEIMKMRRDIALMSGYDQSAAAHSVVVELMFLRTQVGGRFPELDAALEELERRDIADPQR